MATQKHIQGLDGLRAIAIIWIFLYHLDPKFFKGGFIGVSIFFIISGCLLYVTTYRQFNYKSFNIQNFYFKKIKRIYPELLYFMIGCSIFFLIFQPTAIQHIFQEGLSIIGSYNNWYQIFSNQDYFSKMTSGSPFTHLWYLAVQMQFYLFWPLIYIFLCKHLNLFPLVIGITISVCLMWAEVNNTNGISRVYYGSDTRLFSLLIGVLLGIFYIYYSQPIDLKNRHKLIILCLLVIELFIVDGSALILYRGGMLVNDLLLAVIIGIIVIAKKPFKLLESPLLKFIGNLSFEIYLVHYPIIFFFNSQMRYFDLITILLIISLTLLLAIFLKFVSRLRY